MTLAHLAQGPVVGLGDRAAGGILDTRPARVSKPNWLPKSGGQLMVVLAQVAAERLLWLNQEETLQQMSEVDKTVCGAKTKT